MKLEAIREDRTRGGRSTYQCSYTLPNSLLSPPLSAGGTSSTSSNPGENVYHRILNGPIFKIENDGSHNNNLYNIRQQIPQLLQVCFIKKKK